MATIPSLPSQTSPLATDEYPMCDVTDLTQSTTGTTKKTTLSQIQSYVSINATSDKLSVLAASTVALTVSYNNGTAGVGATLTNGSTLAAFSIDGVTPAINSRILIKNQASAIQNGIYTLTTVGSASVAWVLTRSTDYDNSVAGSVAQGTFVAVSTGTVNAATFWIQVTANPIVIGTDSIVFVANTATVSGIVPLSQGGTSANLTASVGAIPYSTASAMAFLAAGTAGKLLAANGASAPVWTTPTYPTTSGTANKFILSDGTNNVYSTYTISLGGNVSTAGSLTLAGAYATTFNFSGATNVTFPTSGTLATVGQILTPHEITTTSVSLIAGSTYILNNAGLVTCTMPLTAAQGTFIFLYGKGSGLYTVVLNSGQKINVGNITTTVTTGSVTSLNQFDCIGLYCITADTEWNAFGIQGNFTIT